MIITSCNRNKIYDHYNHTPIAGWEKNDTLIFDIPPIIDAGVYQETIGLRINDAYPFMGLCLIVEQTIEPSHIVHIDTLNCRLIDHNGIALGQGISYYQYNFHLTNLHFNAKDSVHVSIRHNMKREILPGISDIGISLTKRNI